MPVLLCTPTFFLLDRAAAHVAVVLAGERLWRFTRRETCLASNANIGGKRGSGGLLRLLCLIGCSEIQQWQWGRLRQVTVNMLQASDTDPASTCMAPYACLTVRFPIGNRRPYHRGRHGGSKGLAQQPHSSTTDWNPGLRDSNIHRRRSSGCLPAHAVCLTQPVPLMLLQHYKATPGSKYGSAKCNKQEHRLGAELTQ